MTLRDNILAGIASEGPKAVEVPEWSCSVYIRPFTVGEFLELVSGDEGADRTFDVLAAALCDEEGAALFTVDDLTAMPATQTAVLTRLAGEVQAMNGADDMGEA